MAYKDNLPLKVSLHGMSARMHKMMESYFTLVCSDIAMLATDDEAQAEIVDVDSPQANNLLKQRLEKRPSKPIIVISLYEVSSTEVIYVKKPLVVPVFIHALLTAQEMIQNKKSLKKPITGKMLADTTTSKTRSKPRKTSVPDTQSKVNKKKNVDKLSSARKVKADKKKIAKEASKLLQQITKVDENADLESIAKSQRKAVRYMFEGIEGILKIKSLLGQTNLAVKVLDISSKGAQIQCNEPLKLHAKVALILEFPPEKDFKISARIIRVNKYKYGLLFEKNHHNLIDYLVNSVYPYNLV